MRRRGLRWRVGCSSSTTPRWSTIWVQSPDAMTGRVVRPPFETTPIFMPGFERGCCPLFIIKRQAEGVLDLLTALPCKNDEKFYWGVSGFAAGHEDIVSAYMIALLAAIDARRLKPIGPPR